MAGRLRKLRQRFGIAAPRVAVRTQVPWYLRWLVIAVLFAFSAAFAAWIYDAGRRFAGFDRSEVEQELVITRGELAKLRTELDKLRAVANAADSKMSIERTTQHKLAQQIRGLGQENARLREELALFESMLASSDAGNAAPLAILRFKVEPDVLPGEYRYRVLLVAAGPRRGKEFQGRLELVVGLTDDGRGAMITVPGQSEPEGPFRLGFKHFQRVDGIFRVSPRARVGSVQLRVYEAGTAAPKLTQSVTLE